VDTRGPPLLPKRAHHPCRQQEGPAPGRDHEAGADEDEAGAGETRGGQDGGGENQRVCLPGVFGQDQGGRSAGVRDGHEGRSADEEEKKDRLPATVMNTTYSRVSSPEQQTRGPSHAVCCTHTIL